MDEVDGQYERFHEPPAEVTRDLLLEWRSPRYGKTHAEDLSNSVWEWLVRSRLSGWVANERHGGPDSFDAGPVWCCDRFGQTSLKLTDGRIILVAGEHEDSYDPDFHIYNDVIIEDPDGGIRILGYPREEFPPTDFHSATLSGNTIILIGNLGYPEDRRTCETQLFILDLTTMRIAAQSSSGDPPGWIHKHEAMLSSDCKSILIRGGKVWNGDRDPGFTENIDEWRLHLGNFRWERVTNRAWPRFELRRRDGEDNRLYEMESALWSIELGIPSSTGWAPPSDVPLFKSLYIPPIPHKQVAENEGEYRVRRISIEETVVRYDEDISDVTITVEGSLPETVLAALCDDLRNKLEQIEKAAYEIKRY